MCRKEGHTSGSGCRTLAPYLRANRTPIHQTAASPNSMNRLPRNQRRLKVKHQHLPCPPMVSSLFVLHGQDSRRRRPLLGRGWSGSRYSTLQSSRATNSRHQACYEASRASYWAFGSQTPACHTPSGPRRGGVAGTVPCLVSLPSPRGRIECHRLSLRTNQQHTRMADDASNLRRHIAQPKFTGPVPPGPAVRCKSARRAFARLKHCNLHVSLAQLGRWQACPAYSPAD